MNFDDLKDFVDDSVTEVTIPTSEGWKCDKCTVDYFHSHDTFKCLKRPV